MRHLLKEQWYVDTKFKKWIKHNCVDKKTICDCEDGDHLIELIEHDSCVRGRVDTVICSVCDTIKEFKIIR